VGSGGIALLFLNSALDAGEWTASRPGRFTPRELAPGIHWIGDRLDAAAYLALYFSLNELTRLPTGQAITEVQYETLCTIQCYLKLMQ
jgi:hypothetical protein